MHHRRPISTRQSRAQTNAWSYAAVARSTGAASPGRRGSAPASRMRHRAAHPLELRQERSRPDARVGHSHGCHQRVVSSLPLLERHLQGSLDDVGRLLDVVGIDDQRLRHFLRRACELRQDQHTRIGRVLRGDILLGHQVHAITQGRHHADARSAIDSASRRRGVERLM